MKRWKSIVLMIILTVLLSGCGERRMVSRESGDEDTKWHTQAERRLGHIVPYKNGFYYMGIVTCLSYYDIDTGESVVLCDKNGCNHDSETCFAYIESMPEVRNDRLYFVLRSGEVYVANSDNTEKEKAFTLLEKEQKEGKLVGIEGFLLTGSYLYFQAQVTDYTEEEVSGKTEYRIYARNLETEKETLIMSAEEGKYHLDLLSAYKDVVYYRYVENNLSSYFTDDMTEEDELDAMEQSQRNSYEELYRRNMTEKNADMVLNVKGGSFIMATDELGIYYMEHGGDGYIGFSKILRLEPGAEKAELVLETEEPRGFDVGQRSTEYLMVNEGGVVTLFDLRTMTPVQMEWEYPAQEAFSYPVPGGFAVPKEQIEDGDGEWKPYLGDAWRYLPL